MSEVLYAEPNPKTPGEYRAEIRKLIVEMKSLNEMIARDQKEIERLRAETNAIMVETWQVIERLRAT